MTVGLPESKGNLLPPIFSNPSSRNSSGLNYFRISAGTHLYGPFPVHEVYSYGKFVLTSTGTDFK